MSPHHQRWLPQAKPQGRTCQSGLPLAQTCVQSRLLLSGLMVVRPILRAWTDLMRIAVGFYGSSLAGTLASDNPDLLGFYDRNGWHSRMDVLEIGFRQAGE